MNRSLLFRLNMFLKIYRFILSSNIKSLTDYMVHWSWILIGKKSQKALTRLISRIPSILMRYFKDVFFSASRQISSQSGSQSVTLWPQSPILSPLSTLRRVYISLRLQKQLRAVVISFLNLCNSFVLDCMLWKKEQRHVGAVWYTRAWSKSVGVWVMTRTQMPSCYTELQSESVIH